MSVDQPLLSSHPSVSTCSVLLRVLRNRQLHAADELFSVGNFDIISELDPAIDKIKKIINEKSYPNSEADQQLIELVLSRITACFPGESTTIETYAPALVDLMENCLNHNMSVGLNTDSCYCKIVKVLLNILFLFHSKQSVMIVAIPASVKMLSNANSDLVRSISTYFSLSAIHNAQILSTFSVELIGFALKGNRTLLRVLPQIYPHNREPFHAHLAPLLTLLYDSNSSDTTEKLALLQLFNLIANVKPDLIVPQLSNLDSFLLDCATCSVTLKLFTSLINQGRMSVIIGQLMSLRQASLQSQMSAQNLGTLVQIFAQIAKTTEKMASIATNDAIFVCKRLGGQQLVQALREIEGIAEIYPHVVSPHVETISELAEKHPTAYAVYTKIRTIVLEVSSKRDDLYIYQQIPLPNVIDSLESLGGISKRSSRGFPSDPAPFHTPAEEVVAVELDRNTQHLADSYRLRSNGSLGLGQPRSRSFLSLTAPSGNRPHDPTSHTTNRTGFNEHTGTLNSSNVIPDPTPEVTVQTVIPLSSHPFVANIQLGRDGRVRPISSRPTQRSNWKDSLTPLQSSTTTFPVLDRMPNRGHALNGSQVRMIDEHVAKSRSQSIRSSRANSAAAEPNYESRGDLVHQFVSHRRSKIRRYVNELNCQYPIPVKCTIEGVNGKRHGNKMRIHFACEMRKSNCIFNNPDRLFVTKTQVPKIWLHLMFLHIEAAHLQLTGQILAQDSTEYKQLSSCWSILPKEVTKSQPFATLVTSAFPGAHDQKQMLNELQNARLFDSFFFDAVQKKWGCFCCAYPERINKLIKNNDTQSGTFLEGRLKERRGGFWFFRRWQTRHFTLSSTALTYSNRSNSKTQPTIELSKIRSVRSLSQGRKRKSLPRAFEIFTVDDKALVLKPADRTKVSDWVQCLQYNISQAQTQSHS
ncbi:Protein melted-like protein [Aphelenchoides besseyi]|nr:Protein melted-like protein [Aphelenchoides besseyi]KAI6194365.1 Protein melted-like protein [Aphelenchoides besseyi]